MSDTNTITTDKKVSKGNVLSNPFPGLRAFESQESKLFFGRDGQGKEIISKLNTNRFVAVLGDNSVGKSSLVNCSVISEYTSGWSIFKTQPGGDPLKNLCSAIDTKTAESNYKKLLNKEISLSKLCSDQVSNGKVLIYIDQFEEVFKYDINTKEKEVFVASLIEVVADKSSNISLIISMRAAHMGEAAQFDGLAGLINNSFYLLSQISSGIIASTITEPLKLCKVELATDLANLLKKELEQNPEKLPLAQHALMRTWDYWSDLTDQSGAIELKHYEAVGGIEKSISSHADEIYDSFNEDQQVLCEKLFKTIVDKSGAKGSSRTPRAFGEIVTRLECEAEQVKPVIDVYRKKGNNFINPSEEVSISVKTVIDVQNEIVLNNWNRLNDWANDEFRAVQLYLRLSSAAALYQTGDAELWRPPDLQLALNWKEQQKPTLGWATPHNPSFERAMVFLDTSYKEYTAEEEKRVLLQKRALRRARVVQIILGTAAIISLIIMVYAFDLQQKAEKQKLLAVANAEEAERQSQIAKEQEQLAVAAAQRAEEEAENARQQKEIADAEADRAEREAANALAQQRIAEEQSFIARKNAKEANKQRAIAVNERDKAEALRRLTIAKSNAIKSYQIKDDPQVKALLAKQAHTSNTEFGGKEYDPDVYNALFFALKTLEKEGYNKLKGHVESVRSLVFSPTDNTLYSTGANSQILGWDINNTENYTVKLAENEFINRTLSISKDGKWLACGDEGSNIALYNLETPNAEPILLSGHTGIVWALVFTPDNKELISAGEDKKVLAWDIKTKQNRTIYNSSNAWINSLSINQAGTLVAGGSSDGKVLIWERENNYDQEVFYEDPQNENIQAVRFSKDGGKLAVGNVEGNVKLIDLENTNNSINFTGQLAEIMEIRFSPDGNLLASASRDGSVRLWNINVPEDLPVVLKDESSWILSMAFSNDGNYLLTGDKQSNIEIYPIKTDLMADRICEFVTRNFTPKEWEQYIAPDVKYEKTCSNLPAGETN